MSQGCPKRLSVESIKSVEEEEDDEESISDESIESTDSYVSQTFINIIETSYKRVPVILSNVLTSYNRVYFLNELILKNKQINIPIDENKDVRIDIPRSYSKTYGFIVYYLDFQEIMTIPINPDLIHKMSAYMAIYHKNYRPIVVRREKKIRGKSRFFIQCSDAKTRVPS
jgi:hypothetical protein